MFTNAVSISFVSNYYNVLLKYEAAVPANKLDCPGPGPAVPFNTTTSPTPPSEELPSFTELLIQSKSDKYHRHHYEKFYEKWFAQYREKPSLKILEIGAEAGKSLDFWSNYFTDAALVLGLAYGVSSTGVEDKAEALKKVRVIRGDQAKSDTMAQLKAEGPFHIILDDGSHVPEHEIFSLFSLWNSIIPGGMYIIEDLETHYWKEGEKIYGYPLKNHGVNASADKSAIAKVQQLIHVLNRHQIGRNNLSVMPGDDMLCSIEFAMNTLVLRKCTMDEAGLIPQGSFGNNINTDELDVWEEQAKASNPSPDHA